MAKQRAIGFAHGRSKLLPHGIIGFDERQSNDAIVMPRHDFWRSGRVGWICQKVEDERFTVAACRRGQGEAEIDHCVNKASFRSFDFLPA